MTDAHRHTEDATAAALSPRVQQALRDAKQALARGDAATAERSLLAAMALVPAHAETLRLMGSVRAAQGRYAEATDCLHQSLALRDDDPLTHNSLGNALGSIGDKAGAAAAFSRACALAPGVAAFHFNLGKALAEDGRNDEAVIALAAALRLAPEDQRTALLYAQNLRVSGQLDKAAARYRALVGPQNDCAEAWLGLSNLKNLRFDAADVVSMEQVARARLNVDDEISIRFALARGYEDLDRYADAFRTYVDANARVRRLFPWDAKAFSARVDEFIAVTVPPDRRARPDLGSEAIFIVSMPRSGSSLTEQILASHPLVDGAGELNDLPAVLQEESQRRGSVFPRWVADATAADWQRLGERYLERTARWRGARPRFTDKLPDNWRHVGAIAAMLPGARIVICERDPLETALACFRQLFSRGGQAFSYDIADLAAYTRDFRRAAAQWCERYSAQTCEQRYEALLADLEGEVRRLLEFCRLPFDPACLRFHETERTVRTASASQVREPLRRDTARAAKYGALLDPLRAALGLPPFAG